MFGKTRYVRINVITGFCLLLIPYMNGLRATESNPSSLSRSNTWRKPLGPKLPTLTIPDILRSGLPSLPDINNVGAISQWLRVIARSSHRIHVTVIGHSGNGREILGVIAGGEHPESPQMPTVAIICRQHGNEPAPTLAALEIILDVATNIAPDKYELLQHMRFAIVPVASPDGAVTGHRFVQGWKNPNRDWGISYLPETCAVETFLRGAHPDVLLDCHELLPGDYESRPYIECGADGEKLAKRVLIEAEKDHCPLVLGHTAVDCPSALLYRYFPRVYHKPAVMLESALVGDHQIERRARLHRAAAWAAAKFVVLQARLERR